MCIRDRSTVRSFHDPFDGQALKSQELILLLLDCAADPFLRSHFTPGHITCTGFVLAPDGERILIVHHRRLDRWLLPGGHVEAEDVEIWDAARREVIEETGAELVPDTAPRLVSMDVHGIPSNGREPYHLHQDVYKRQVEHVVQFDATRRTLPGLERLKTIFGNRDFPQGT